MPLSVLFVVEHPTFLRILNPAALCAICTLTHYISADCVSGRTLFEIMFYIVSDTLMYVSTPYMSKAPQRHARKSARDSIRSNKMTMCVAVCCGVLQCVVVCCSVYLCRKSARDSIRSTKMTMCVAVCCGVLQCVVVCCSVLLCVAALPKSLYIRLV